jgi:hypothetical protein
MSALGHKRTHALQQRVLLFDNLVCAFGVGQQGRRHGKPECPRSFDVDCGSRLQAKFSDMSPDHQPIGGQPDGGGDL